MPNRHHECALSLLSFAAQNHAEPLPTPETTTKQSSSDSHSSLMTNDPEQETNGDATLIYVGVSMDRPLHASCMSLFRISNHYVVGAIQQNLMNQFTRWGWASRTLRTSPNNSRNFQSNFGPLITSVPQQLVPGDVILSINGKTQFDDSIWSSPRLDILAARLETARHAAERCVSLGPKAAADIAYYVMEPMLRERGFLPSTGKRYGVTAQRPSASVRVVSEESLQQSSFNDEATQEIGQEREGSDEGIHSPTREENTTKDASHRTSSDPLHDNGQERERSDDGVDLPMQSEGIGEDASQGTPTELLHENGQGQDHSDEGTGVSMQDEEDAAEDASRETPTDSSQENRHEREQGDEQPQTHPFVNAMALIQQQQHRQQLLHQQRFALPMNSAALSAANQFLPLHGLLQNTIAQQSSSQSEDALQDTTKGTLPTKRARSGDDVRPRKKRPALVGESTTSVAPLVPEQCTAPMLPAPRPPKPTSYQDPLVFLCFKLKRTSLATPWGIHVSHNDRNFLGVGRVSPAVEAHTKWGLATASLAGNSHLLNTANETMLRLFFQQKPLDSSASLSIAEGDFILSVSGRAISTFSSLSEIATYMTRATELLLIVVRHSVSLQVARLAKREGKDGLEVADTAFRQLQPILSRRQNDFGFMFTPRPLYLEPRALAPVVYRNPLFRDENGNAIVFDDTEDIDDGTRAAEFLPQITAESFPSWLKKRKATWRQGWNLPMIDSDGECWGDDESPSIATDFWSHQGYGTFDEWLAASTFRWKQSYSWNCKKREQIAKEFEEIVHFPSNGCGRDHLDVEQGRHWLRVRKHQWRFLRRKRQRDQAKLTSSSNTVAADYQDVAEDINMGEPLLRDAEQCASPGFAALSPRKVVMPRQTSADLTIIDALLAEQESQQEKLRERQPLDISFLFDARLGAPDVIVVHCLEYLPRSEHAKLLCVSATTSASMKERDEVWRQLCPSHWVLPRRPRKRWHEIYLTKIFDEVKASRKWADEFLSKAADILFKQDNLNSIEKLVAEGEKRVDFDVNYVSGVVCERNSLLNLAAIYSRSKVVRWLIETKGADIETYDRGGFTPLLNAAWVGDRQLVRYLLSRGADRSKVGLFHFFKPLSSPDFKGLNAEGWARKKGHDKLADLIRVGL